jgi:antitoxin CcdA
MQHSRIYTMQALTNTTKKATNITLSSDVLIEAKALGINISQSCDQFLRELVRNERERRWQQENADYIAAYNQTVSDEGCHWTHGGRSNMPRFCAFLTLTYL